MAIDFRYVVKLEDGSTFEAHADQRDVAAFELEPFGVSFMDAASRPFTFARYLAWHAARRAKHTNLTWAEFAEQCTDVEAVGQDEEDTDPGQSAASAES